MAIRQRSSRMEFNTQKYKVYRWNHWMKLHWILNPGLAINELVFGQRMPKVTLVDKTSDQPKFERTYIPCPHCHTLHDARTWSPQNETGFKNWFGLYCPTCHEIIPCLWNVLSAILLGLSFPLWSWFLPSLKQRWLRKQPARYQKIEPSRTPNIFGGRAWFLTGFSWGCIMFFVIELGFPLVMSESLSWSKLLVTFPVWIAAGLIFGYTMKVISTRKGSDDFVNQEAD